MRVSPKTIATAVFAVLLLPAFLLNAKEPATPSGGAKTDAAVDSNSTSSAEPAAATSWGSMGAVSPYTAGRNLGTPTAELFMGYSYLRAMPELAVGNRLVYLNGGSTSIAFNFNRYLGVVADFGGFDDSQILFAGTGTNASTTADSSGTAYTYLFGPRLSLRGHGRVTPFAQVLFGGIHASAVTLSSGCTGPGCTPLPTENSFALTAGGGLDLKVHRHFAIRLIQAEYLMTRFEVHSTGNGAMQNDMRLASGIVFRFGGNTAPPMPPAPPLAYSCSVKPTGVFQGETIALSGTAVYLNPARSPVYTWSVDGGTVSAVASKGTIDTKNVAVGAYTLKGRVSEGDKPSENADCAASYVVKAYEPPTVGCSANPSTVLSGDASTITAIGVSPQNRPLTYSYGSTSGTMTGNGPTATLSTAGAAIGTVAVTCSVADDKNQTASGTTSVMVMAPVAAPKPQLSELCSVHFDRDPRRPSRVDNEAKACLDDIALNLQRNSDATLAVEGNLSIGEKGGNKLAAERAVNTKAYLVGGKGIDSSRIAVYTGSQDGKKVSTILIPAGATLDKTGLTPVQ
jgi:outer membrane protein OmpA-like peptidoglycan-associated protein